MPLPDVEFSMMELAALRQLVRRGEGLHLEFKRKANHPDKIVRELIAFANTEGGILLIGVDDDATIYGSKRPLEDKYALEQALEQLVTPRIRLQIQQVPVTSSRSVLWLTVKPSRLKPHFFRPDGPGTPKTAYVRVADMSVQASWEWVSLMKLQRSKQNTALSYDQTIRTVLQYLEIHPNITLAEAQNLLKTTEREVSRLLVHMASAGLIRLLPGQQGDRFVLAPESFLD